MPKQKKQPTKKGFLIKWGAITGSSLALVIVINYLMFNPFQTVLNNYFRPRVERTPALTAASTNLCEEIEADGIVLLKNQNNSLPLAPDKLKVNVFGWSSTNPVYGGTGSGAVNPAVATDFLSGLQQAGIECNTTITDFYKAFRTSRPSIAIRSQDWTVPEPSMKEYDAAGIFESAAEFSDTAIIYIARSGGEGADIATSLPSANGIEMKEIPDGRTVSVGLRSSDYPDDYDADKHYLELSNRELAMVERVTSEFDNVIVLLNTGNSFELDWVDTYNVDSLAWIGGPGESGFKAVGNMLTGKVNPSGRTVDTFTKDLKAGPEFANFGHYAYTGSDKLTTWTGDPATRPGYQFVNYIEGIYVGYRFYETFYLNNEEGYQAAVKYPFGYGLSYSKFTQRMGELTVNGDTISVDVTVTNTGNAAGKEVVQLYSTAPYTEGGIEKAHVVLVAFDKTNILQPGESETLTLSLSIENDLTSYDDKTARAYVLEQGVYEIKLMKNAHEMIDSKEYTVANTIVYGENNKRESDTVAAVNQFDFANGGYTYLSRANNFENYQTALIPAKDRAMTPAEEAAIAVHLPTDETAVTPTVGAKNGLTLQDMVGKSYDDPDWEPLLDQLTDAEMTEMIVLGGYQTKPASSVEKPATVDIDGPQGLSSFMGASVRAGAYPTAMVIASTWNTDLALARGKMVGMESLELGVHGWYAPSMNIHRSPFAGRNFEYYSEDGFLSGKMGAAETAGAKEMGLYGYIKHFALNDQETNRNSQICTWSNEQAMREIYLKPFELSVKEGGAFAVMSSYNYIGSVWAGGCMELLNTVLRGEWNFREMVLTDYFGDYGYMDSDQAIANGNDIMLSTLGRFGAELNESSNATGKSFMRTASKNILYTVANSNAMYTVAQRNEKLQEIGGHVSEMDAISRAAYYMGSQNWMLITYAIDALIAVLFLALIVFKYRKYKKLFPSVA